MHAHSRLQGHYFSARLSHFICQRNHLDSIIFLNKCTIFKSGIVRAEYMVGRFGQSQTAVQRQGSKWQLLKVCVKTSQTFADVVQSSHLVLPQNKEQTLTISHSYCFNCDTVWWCLPSAKLFTVTPDISSASFLVFIELGLWQQRQLYWNLSTELRVNNVVPVWELQH